MFERFTDQARRVIVLAQEEARLLDHDYIGTEHILLGVIHEGEGVAAQALASLEIDLTAVREAVERLVPRGESTPSGHIPFTPHAKKVLELSLREALRLGHDYIGTEHILLGLVREREGMAAKALVQVGGDLDLVRQRIEELVTSPAGPGTREGRAEAEAVTMRLSAGGQVRARLAGSRGELLARSRDQVVFRRFTVSACRVLLLAESEALRLGQAAIGVEHLLLGLLAEEEGVAARALGTLGLDLAGVRTTAERILGRGELRGAPEPTYREDLIDAIERSLYETLAAGSERIDTDHLLLGLVHQAENRGGLARQALQVLGTDPAGVRRAVADTEPPPKPEPDPPITSVIGVTTAEPPPPAAEAEDEDEDDG
jgi:ATP-dependent Clp protease ATP-binding subunit ClpA